MKSHSESYKNAGVDITAGYKAVELMKKHIARTVTGGNDNSIGGFGGLFTLDLKGYSRPVLVSGTDGVGTKLKIAFLMDKHDTVGIDCVAMCVNDIICSRLHSVRQKQTRKNRRYRGGRSGRLRSVGR